MATSKAQIFSYVTTLLGQPSISNPDGTDEAETACRQVYDISRQSLLEEHSWNFSLRRASLAPNSTAPAFDYLYSFNKPSDCLRILKMYNHRGRHKEEGGKILSDQNTMNLIYVKDITDVVEFPPLFSQLLAVDIAIAVEYRITNQNVMQNKLFTLRTQLLIKAKMIDAQKDNTPKKFKSNTKQAMYTPYGDLT
jgi:ribosomal protein L24